MAGEAILIDIRSNLSASATASYRVRIFSRAISWSGV
jgi:hypothetical protein